MRKLMLLGLALVSAMLGYLAPHTPVTFTVVHFRDRTIASSQNSEAQSETKASAPNTKPVEVCRTDVALDATEIETRVAELAESLIADCRTANTHAYPNPCVDVRILRRTHPQIGTRIVAFEEDLAKACQESNRVEACSKAAEFFRDQGDFARAHEVERVGCSGGVSNDCDELLQSLGWEGASSETQYEVAVLGCKASQTVRDYCDRIRDQPYSPELFASLKYENSPGGLRLLGGPVEVVEAQETPSDVAD